MSNYIAGHNAEKRAAAHLRSLDFKILDINWKNKYCEIDIVASKSNVIYFIEVKYRRNTKYGSGLDYITQKKLRRMEFAAEVWVQTNKWSGQYQLAAISIDAENITFIDEI